MRFHSSLALPVALKDVISAEYFANMTSSPSLPIDLSSLTAATDVAASAETAFTANRSAGPLAKMQVENKSIVRKSAEYLIFMVFAPF